jgi:hypothetical protein
MNVTASKVLLGVSLAALTYTSWDHLFTSKAEAPPPPKTRELTASMVNRGVVLTLARDPFESRPLDGVGQPLQPLAEEPGKELADLTLQGVLISPTGRMALVNGRMLREGEVMESAPGKAKVRARRVGIDYAVIEGAGQVRMLRVEEPNLYDDDGPAAVARPRTATASAGN